MTSYYWFAYIGFYFTLGVIFAVVACKLVWELCSRVVNLFWKDKDSELNEALFTVLPPRVSAMHLELQGDSVRASCTYNGSVVQYVEPVASHGNVKDCATRAQLELIARISEYENGIVYSKGK